MQFLESRKMGKRKNFKKKKPRVKRKGEPENSQKSEIRNQDAESTHEITHTSLGARRRIPCCREKDQGERNLGRGTPGTAPNPQDEPGLVNNRGVKQRWLRCGA